MSESQAGGGHAFWRVEGHSLAIEYSLGVLDEICSAVVDAFYCAPRGGVEVGGVLFGLREENIIRVRAFRLLACEYAAGPSYLLSPKDEADLRLLLEKSTTDPALKRLCPLGWFHSHTRSDIFLSPEDVEVYNRHFPEPWQVALVLRPGKLAPTKAGFFLREPNGSLRTESSYREFCINPTPKPRSRTPRPRRERKPTPEPVVPHTPAEAVPIEVEPPRFTVETESPGPWRWIGIAVITAAILVAGGLGMKTFWFADPPSDLALCVSDSNGHLRIDWDHNAKAIRDAQSATLQIGDGDNGAKLGLDREQLRRGSVTYVRHGDNVSVRMILSLPAAKPLEAVALFLGQPVSPKAGPASEEEDPDSEVAALRARLEKETARSQNLQRAVTALQRKVRAASKK